MKIPKYSKKFDDGYAKHHIDSIKSLDNKLTKAINALLNNERLEGSFNDHKLKGDKSNLREFHLKPNLVVTYYIEGEYIYFEGLGTHGDTLNMSTDLLNLK